MYQAAARAGRVLLPAPRQRCRSFAAVRVPGSCSPVEPCRSRVA